MVRVHDKIRQGEKLLAYFTQGQWGFVNDNLNQLEKLLNDTDKQIFTTNMNEIVDLPSYFDDIMFSIKARMFNEDMERIDYAKRKLKV